MALNISEIVGQFKADVAKALSAETIGKICRFLDYTWRDRVLDPVTTTQVFLLQILHGNTACSAMSRLAGVPFTGAAYCAARARLPLALFQFLLQRVCDALVPELQETGRWLGHRTWSLDGSSFSMSDTPELQAHFGQPSGQAKGCGFPVAHLLALFHAGTGLLLRVIASPMRTHDMRHTPLMHAELGEGDILLADRGFASFAHLALLILRKMHAVFRCHQKQIVSFRVGRKHTKQSKPKKGLPRSRYVRRLAHWDQLVEYLRPKSKPIWMDDETWDTLPETLLLRELRFRTPQRGHRTRVITLVTTLLDPNVYPAAALAELYLSRWQIEISQPYHLQRCACISARARTTVWPPSREDDVSHVFFLLRIGAVSSLAMGRLRCVSWCARSLVKRCNSFGGAQRAQWPPGIGSFRARTQPA